MTRRLWSGDGGAGLSARFRMNAWWWLRCQWDRRVLFPSWKEPRTPDPPSWSLWPALFFERRYYKALRELRP